MLLVFVCSKKISKLFPVIEDCHPWKKFQWFQCCRIIQSSWHTALYHYELHCTNSINKFLLQLLTMTTTQQGQRNMEQRTKSSINQQSTRDTTNNAWQLQRSSNGCHVSIPRRWWTNKAIGIILPFPTEQQPAVLILPLYYNRRDKPGIRSIKNDDDDTPFLTNVLVNQW